MLLIKYLQCILFFHYQLEKLILGCFQEQLHYSFPTLSTLHESLSGLNIIYYQHFLNSDLSAFIPFLSVKKTFETNLFPYSAEVSPRTPRNFLNAENQVP